MRVLLFWGTPDFAVPSLRALQEEGHAVVAVVTQPDRPAGRGRSLRQGPIKVIAHEEGIPVLQPEKPTGPEFLARLRGYEPDVSVVAAYGHILVDEVLELPPRGSINVHASLLPELRGAAPVNWAIIRGHAQSGVTIMRMVRELDAGPVLYRVGSPWRCTPRSRPASCRRCCRRSAPPRSSKLSRRWRRTTSRRSRRITSRPRTLRN